MDSSDRGWLRELRLTQLRIVRQRHAHARRYRQRTRYATR